MQIIFFPSHDLSSFPFCPFDGPIFYFLSILMVIISLELTRINQVRNIFSKNVEQKSTFLTPQKFGPLPTPNISYFLLIDIFTTYNNTVKNLAHFEDFYIEL